MAEWPNASEMAQPYAWTGAASLLGRLMYHARQVQQGHRKPVSWALLLDLPIALAMGWLIYGVCVWADFSPELTISAAIAAAYLGPWTVDRMFAVLADRYFGTAKGGKE